MRGPKAVPATVTGPVRLNPHATVRLRRCGTEQTPVLVIDDLLLDPQDLVEAAAAAAWGPPAGTYYPGPNAPLPDGYLRDVIGALRPSFARAFGLSADRRLVVSGFFALATRQLPDLGPWQRIPHYDQLFPDHLAMVHYLSPHQGGGTGFFRHRPTGYESINDLRRDGYLSQVTQWLDSGADPLTTFAGPDTPQYDLLDRVDFRFNRAVIYPSNVLHCALFDGATLTADPRTGRLTANSFCYPDALVMDV